MTENKILQLFPDKDVVLRNAPSFIWPEPRWHTGQGRYNHMPPSDSLIEEADLINGMLVNTSDKAVEWLNTLLKKDGKRRILLVVIVYPAGPTRQEHLLNLQNLQNRLPGTEQELEVRILPVSRAFGHDFEKMIMPPSVLQAIDSQRGKTWFCIGSVGDFGQDEAHISSFNMVFEPDDGLRDHWRRWFQYLLSSSASLTSETAGIPHLVPPEGDPAAAEMWADFVNACHGLEMEKSNKPTVDPVTGEVTKEPDGTQVQPWDEGKTKLDPLAQELQRVYSQGYLVTVDETTPIKPLAIPVKAALLDQRSERIVGALTQKQSFTLQVLGANAAKEVEKCRLVNDLMGLLTYLLSQGNRWLPEAAKSLLEKELEIRNQRGMEALRKTFGGTDVPQFIANRRESIRNDLDAMYRQLSQGTSVPEDKFNAILEDVENRLSEALKARITPKAVYNRISPSGLTASAPEENWHQPLSLLTRSARLLRESLTDRYFPRRFIGLSFSEKEFRTAMDIWGDVIVKKPDPRQAQAELDALAEIESSPKGAKEKCVAIWRIITGKKET
jgi:hypothetical protein